MNDEDIKEEDVIDVYSKGVLKDVDLTERGEYEGKGSYEDVIECTEWLTLEDALKI